MAPASDAAIVRRVALPLSAAILAANLIGALVAAVSEHGGSINKSEEDAALCLLGAAVAGNIGAAERFEYTVIGEPVTLRGRGRETRLARVRA
jgi:class 3 adenylate cyclase